MADTVCSNFESYIAEAQNIFDIMAAAYKAICPFDPLLFDRDSSLNEMVSCFSEQYNVFQAFDSLKGELLNWIHMQAKVSRNILRTKLYFLIRLIDQKCVRSARLFLPDSYSRYFSLNHLFQNEFCILPRSQDSAITLLSKTLVKKSGYGFYPRNQGGTGDISGFLKNFIIYRKSDNAPAPRLILPNYCQEILEEFELNNHKLRVGVFPLSNINLKHIFQIEEEIIGKEGLFYIKSAVEEQERKLLERCTEILSVCREQHIDIAVFPEMLFTSKNQNAILNFIRKNDCGEEGLRFPWFIWLGTSWAEKENKCMVIDQYGKVVFEQKKYTPYQYKKIGENVPDTGTSDRAENIQKNSADTIIIREALSHEGNRIVNFLELSGLLRIATAICRDISDDQLRAVLKGLYTDMVVIPAFSGSNRLTERNVTPLALDQIITLVCNACSALCSESQDTFEVNKQMIGRENIFCYLCLPAKEAEDNAADYHIASFTSACNECEKRCNGYIWEIDFSDCLVKENLWSAKVI